MRRKTKRAGARAVLTNTGSFDLLLKMQGACFRGFKFSHIAAGADRVVLFPKLQFTMTILRRGA